MPYALCPYRFYQQLTGLDIISNPLFIVLYSSLLSPSVFSAFSVVKSPDGATEKDIIIIPMPRDLI